MNNSIHNDEQIVQRQVIKKYNGARPWQVAVLMLMSAAVAALVLFVALLGGKGRYRLIDGGAKYDSSLISTLLSEIDKYYYFHDDAPDTEKLLEDAAHDIVNSIGDPYAAYYTNEEYEAFENSINGSYKGIGVLLGVTDGNGAEIVRVYEGNPAAKAGIREGDTVIAVDGKSTLGLPHEEVSDLISGLDGTTVALTIKRGEETLEIDVERGDVYIKRVYTEILENSIGYIRIESFTGNAVEEFNEGLDGLLGQGIESLIIDLRNNPGGSLDVVVAICDRILPECTITTLEGKLVDPPQSFESTAEQSLEIPYAVLINENSASSSEIFASAVQDNKCAALIGKNTYGKGIVQSSWALRNGQGYIKLTTDVYRTPNGKLIHEIGVAPDIEVEQDVELVNYDIFFIMRDFANRDLQLKAAIDYLNNK